MWRASLAVILVASAAHGQLRFESQPDTTASINQPYRYDLDGVPSVSTDAGVPYSFSLGVHPADMYLENLTGELLWFPTVPGAFPVELIVSDTLGSSATQAFTVNVSAGAAPDFSPPPTVEVSLGATVSLQLVPTAGDPPLTWQLAAGPQGALLQPELGSVSWLPTAAGVQPFSIRLSNAFGSVTRTFEVSVTSLTLPSPTAQLTATPEDPVPGTLVRLSAAGSSAGTPDASLSYLFDFGDGSPSRYGVEDSTQQGYVVPGTYFPRVIVENVHLSRAEATARVVVRTDGGLSPPTARIRSSVSSGESAPLLVQFDCDCAAGDSELVSYQWEFGDGEQADVKNPTHVFASAGGYNVKLRVVDALGLEARDGFYLPVFNPDGGSRPPFARARVRPTAVGDVPFSPQLVAEFGDSDGIVVKRRWRLPDGREVLDEDPTLQLQSLGAVRVELTVEDNDGLTSTDVLELKATRNGLLPPEIKSEPSIAARVGEPFLYDEDGRAAARNGPVRWSVGLVVDAQRVGAPEGFTVDEASGAIRWVPTAAQLGVQDIALVATNAAGSTVQRFSVAVAQRPATGCGCALTPDLGLWAAVPLLALRRRRRRPSGG